MGIHKETITHHFVICDWCGKKEKVTHIDFYGDPVLTGEWERDWLASKDFPPIYCNSTHMERAREVTELKKLP